MEKVKQSLLPLLLTVFIDLIGVGIVIPVLEPLLLGESNTLNLFQNEDSKKIILGLLLASFAFMQFFGAPILGALSDNYGRKKLLIISLLGTFTGYILFALGIMYQNITLLFVGRIIDGFTGGNISIAQSAVADLSTNENRVKNFGLIGMTFGLGFIIGPTLGGILADPSVVSWFNFSTPFWFAAALTFINIILLIFNFKETLSERIQTEVKWNTSIKSLIKAFKTPNVRKYFLIAFLLMFGFSLFTQFVQVYLDERFGYQQAEIGKVFGYVGIWSVITQGFLVRIFSNKFKPRQILKYALLGLAVSLPSILLIPNGWWLLVTIPFNPIFQGFNNTNLTAIISSTAGPKNQGEMLGIIQSINSSALALAPAIAGLLSTIYVGLPILAASFIVFIAWIVFVRTDNNSLR